MRRQRIRIVKPRSAKQRAQAQRFSRRSPALTLIPKDTGLPDSSWWAYAPQDGFTRIAQLQAQRMRRSQFGTLRNPTFGDEA